MTPHDGKTAPVIIVFETPKEANAMIDLVAIAMKTKINKRSNAYKLATLIDEEFLY